MRVRPGLARRFRAQPEGFLYDVHGGAFARLDRGVSIVEGFVPIWLSRLFGVRVVEWRAFLRRSLAELEALPPSERDAYVAAHAPVMDATRAVETALLVYPEAERFFRLTHDETAPYVLRDEHLHQPNLALTAFEERDDTGWTPLVEGEIDAHAIRELLLAETAASRTAVVPSPGVYLLGHSGLLIRGAAGGLLVDPVPWSDLAVGPRSVDLPSLRAAASAVAITHSHFDHYHLPSLLGLSDVPLIVPRVPRATVVCEDMEARLRSCGATDVRAPAWGDRLALDGLTLHALPFWGEQFLTPTRYAEARSWGNTYLVECDGARILIVADGGHEPGHSVLEVAASVAPVDLVITQAIALRTTFGDGDPDVQLTALTCARDARRALELLRPEARVTLGEEDLAPLCRAAGARRLLLYGQFSWERDAPSVEPALVARVRARLATAAPEVQLFAPAVGEGISLSSNELVRLPAL